MPGLIRPSVAARRYDRWPTGWQAVTNGSQLTRSGLIPTVAETDSLPPRHGVLGLDPRINPAIGYPHQIANDAIPVSNHPMEMAGSSPAMTLVGPLRVVRQQL